MATCDECVENGFVIVEYGIFLSIEQCPRCHGMGDDPLLADEEDDP